MIIKNGSIFFIFFCIISVILFFSNLMIFFDLVSFLTVGSILILFLPAQKGKEKSLEVKIKGRSISWWEFISYCALLMGTIGSLIGYIIIFNNLKDKTFIGPAMAIAVLTSFYGLLIFLFCFLKGRYKVKKMALYYILFDNSLWVSCFLVLILTFPK